MTTTLPQIARRQRLKLLLVIALLLVGLSVAGAAVARKIYYDNLRPVSTAAVSRLIEIPLGSTPQQIADKLEREGLIRRAWAFDWYLRANQLRGSLKAGTYSLKPSLSTAEIAAILTQGRIAQNLVTILPGQRLDQIRDALINYGFKPADVDAALDPQNYASHPALVDKPAGASLEGYLYPESFHKTAQTDPRTIIRASLDEMQKRLTPDVRAAIVRQGLTVHEGIILASIVEQEVSEVIPSDRPQVAQVFLSRLRIGMKLQADATADYGAVLDGLPPIPSYISAYNTYVHHGLTPTPISNVSETSLRAVAFPAATDYLYFVSGDGEYTGKTFFSRTLPEHEELVRRYCRQCRI